MEGGSGVEGPLSQPQVAGSAELRGQILAAEKPVVGSCNESEERGY